MKISKENIAFFKLKRITTRTKRKRKIFYKTTQRTTLIKNPSRRNLRKIIKRNTRHFRNKKNDKINKHINIMRKILKMKNRKNLGNFTRRKRGQMKNQRGSIQTFQNNTSKTLRKPPKNILLTNRRRKRRRKLMLNTPIRRHSSNHIQKLTEKIRHRKITTQKLMKNTKNIRKR